MISPFKLIGLLFQFFLYVNITAVHFAGQNSSHFLFSFFNAYSANSASAVSSIPLSMYLMCVITNYLRPAFQQSPWNLSRLHIAFNLRSQYTTAQTLQIIKVEKI